MSRKMLTSQDMNGNAITNLPTNPSGSNDATSKAYVDSSRITWSEVSSNTTAAGNRGYITNALSSEIVITLPASANQGDIVRVVDIGIYGWKIAQPNVDSVIYFGNQNTTDGTSGYLQNTAAGDAVELLCIDGTASVWTVLSSQGNITIV